MKIKEARYNFLVQQHKNRVYSYSMYMLRNRMDADDVTQEVLIRIWQNLDKFKMSSASAWIMKTTHNLCLDYLRKRSRVLKRDVEIDEIFEESYSDDSKVNDPSIKTHIMMMTSKVKEVIKKLPENLRSVFVLYEIQGMKYKEISSALDIPLNSVKVYLLRARKKIQEELKNIDPREVL
ncbi:MAG: RNA polymerase sigma factor [Melioribacteraceae bacterium]|nr:RNA polymerase sigma factor [Melioribacteraceae bacterium]MCF8356060.1 RNA polymerase sigma factor [Melioribacteraceae bacterium]MCF8394887.1 RNA polymerase sigma factor [Melioribacteraceae bacterium]MCF8420420.1 RNA polymerase sigma factor [Melioribacteraceae bacterium]